MREARRVRTCIGVDGRGPASDPIADIDDGLSAVYVSVRATASDTEEFVTDRWVQRSKPIHKLSMVGEGLRGYSIVQIKHNRYNPKQGMNY